MKPGGSVLVGSVAEESYVLIQGKKYPILYLTPGQVEDTFNGKVPWSSF